MLHDTSAKAVTIEYTVQNLSGSTWEYSYFLSGNTFSQYQGFQIDFDYTTYSALDPFPVAPNADWNPVTFPTNSSGLSPSNGTYDAIALASNPSLANPFVVLFDWSGSNDPSSQIFSLYTCDDDICSTGITFSDTGTTVALNGGGGSPNPNPAPEPLTPLLIALGLFGMILVRQRS